MTTRIANDRILYVGMNEASAATEEHALRATGASVIAIRARDGALDVDRFVEDLAEKYGFGPEQADAIVCALESQCESGRDELARIAAAWAPGETGETIPSRLVISGHHSGGHFWGHTSQLDLDAVRALAQALPNAARQIEDIHFSGCFTECHVKAAGEWQECFPNLRTMWGYAEYAPLAPTRDLVTWERASRGPSADAGVHATVVGPLSSRPDRR
jgi:hypothetical protein